MNQCVMCKGPLEDRRVEHVHQWKGQLYLLKNVPAQVCVQCGETYFGPGALEQMDRIVEDRPEPEGQISVPVYSLR